MRNSRAIVILAVTIGCLFGASRSVQGQCTYDWQVAEGRNGIYGWVRALIEWDPDGAGPIESRLYAAGSFTAAGKVQANNIAAWNGSEWESLGLGLNGEVYSLLIYNNDLIAVGMFSQLAV
jgi:hypothetical protein